MKKTLPAPSIFGAHLRPVREITVLSELSSYNTVFGSYGITVNEVIQFPSCLDSMRVFVQQSPKFSDEKMVHVLIERNGEPSYISLGALHSGGLSMQRVCVLSDYLGSLPNDYERLKYLCGKRITATGYKNLWFCLPERYKCNPLFFNPELNAIPRAVWEGRKPIIEFVYQENKDVSIPSCVKAESQSDSIDNSQEYTQDELDIMYKSAYEGESDAEWNTN